MTMTLREKVRSMYADGTLSADEVFAVTAGLVQLAEADPKRHGTVARNVARQFVQDFNNKEST